MISCSSFQKNQNRNRLIPFCVTGMKFYVIINYWYLMGGEAGSSNEKLMQLLLWTNNTQHNVGRGKGIITAEARATPAHTQ